MFEVEIHMALASEQQAKELLKNAAKVGEQAQVDEYYDFAGLKLYRKKAFLRVRDHRKLNLKYFPQDTHTSVEVAFDFGSAALQELHTIASFLALRPFEKTRTDEQTVKEWLAENSLKPLIVIDKHRATYKDSTYTYMLDDVKGLGKYLEIERETESAEEARQIEEELKAYARAAGVQKFEHKGYVQWYVEKYYPELLKA